MSNRKHPLSISTSQSLHSFLNFYSVEDLMKERGYDRRYLATIFGTKVQYKVCREVPSTNVHEFRQNPC